MVRNPKRQTQTLAPFGLRFMALAILLCSYLAVHAHSQSSANLSALDDRVARLGDGTISGNAYHNAELGFRYQFPSGWIVNDKATQERAVAAGYQFVWADDPSAKREGKVAHQCTKDLLFVTQYPEEMRSNGFNPLAFLIAADPKCVPGVAFPSSVKDHEAIQRIANQLGVFFKTSSVTSRSPSRIRAFDNAG
jgi:hypothetical protein